MVFHDYPDFPAIIHRVLPYGKDMQSRVASMLRPSLLKEREEIQGC